MATEFPIDPEFNRFVEGMPADGGGETPGIEVDIDIDESEIEELPDGTAVVRLDTNGPMDNEDFYQNLADSDVVDMLDLSTIALKYLELIDKDKEARAQRDKQYEEGLRRTGLGDQGRAGFHDDAFGVREGVSGHGVEFRRRGSPGRDGRAWRRSPGLRGGECSRQRYRRLR